jgi:hypothetical protein
MKAIILAVAILLGGNAAHAGGYIPYLGQGDPCGIVGGAADAVPHPGGVLCAEDPDANIGFDALRTGSVRTEADEYGDYIPYLSGFGDPYGLTLTE